MKQETRESGYLSCPVCDAEMPLAGDERPGEETSCYYCQTPLVLKKSKEKDELYFVEDF